MIIIPDDHEEPVDTGHGNEPGSGTPQADDLLADVGETGIGGHLRESGLSRTKTRTAVLNWALL